MELLLDRDVYSRNSTIGVLYVDGKFECFILEDRDRELSNNMNLAEIQKRKVYAKTAIPTGRYEIIITPSNRFKRRLPLLVNVPGFEGIRIHTGNTNEDTEGCLLPGQTRGVDFVGNSRVAFNNLFNKLDAAIRMNKKIFITIKK